jgi:hypothetical protein
LLPPVCAATGLILLAAGSGTARVAGAVLVAIYFALLVASALLAALRFRSLPIGLLFVPAAITSQAAYVVGFLRGLTRSP